MRLSNKRAREEFLENYRDWGIWKQIDELGLKFYRYQFRTGAVVIVTEFQVYSSWKKEYATAKKFCLILDGNDDYIGSSCSGREYYKTYTLGGVGMCTIVDYMTKNKERIIV